MTTRLWSAIVDLASIEVYILASAIAFNALLSFFPFAILMLVICKNLLHWNQGYEVSLELLRSAYLPIGQDLIVTGLRSLTNQYRHSNGLALLSLATLIFTSSGIFGPIEQALNRAWKVTSRRSAIHSQLIAFGLVLGCGILSLAAVLTIATVQSLLQKSLGFLFTYKFIQLFLAVATKLFNLPATIAIFFLIYYCLPNRKVPIIRVLPAAIYIGIFWEIAKYIFVWCLPLLNFQNVYGPLYITVSLVTWAFVSALLLLLGANISSIELIENFHHEEH